MSRYYRSFLEESGVTYTARTTAFASATAITDTTILNALNTFDLGLISNSLDSKMIALYPVVGGTSTAHSYNFMNTSQYQLTFNGGWVHSSTGMKPNSINTFANTGLNANSVLSLNSTHLSYYGRDDSTSSNQSNVLIGAMDSSRLHLYPNANNVSYNSINTSNIYSGAVINTPGLILSSRLSSSSATSYKNSSSVYNDNTTSTAKPNLNIYIGALNNSGSAGYYTFIECSFSSIGSGLTSTDASNLYTLIQAFQTSLSRQV